MIFSSPFLLQTCHTISFGYADKEDFEHTLRFEALGRLRSRYTKGIPSRLASYMDGEFREHLIRTDFQEDLQVR